MDRREFLGNPSTTIKSHKAVQIIFSLTEHKILCSTDDHFNVLNPHKIQKTLLIDTWGLHRFKYV